MTADDPSALGTNGTMANASAANASAPNTTSPSSSSGASGAETSSSVEPTPTHDRGLDREHERHRARERTEVHGRRQRRAPDALQDARVAPDHERDRHARRTS